MIKGRIWRFLTIFFGIYLFFLLYFLRTFSSDTAETTTTSPLPHARVKPIDETVEPIKPPENEPHVLKPDVKSSNLEPVMTKGVLGNYEPLNLVKVPGPGENGEGVQLTGEDKKLGEKSVADYGFNEVASEKISLDRHARDTRYDKR
jgi:hypothetical protein